MIHILRTLFFRLRFSLVRLMTSFFIRMFFFVLGGGSKLTVMVCLGTLSGFLLVGEFLKGVWGRNWSFQGGIKFLNIGFSKIIEFLVGSLSGLGVLGRGFCVGMVWVGVGCNLAPEFHLPSSQVTDGFKYGSTVDSLASFSTDEAWWEVFEDPGLTSLIDQVSTQNYDLQAAVEVLEQSRAAARVERSFLLPEVNVQGFASRRAPATGSRQNFQNVKFNILAVTGLLSYEIDVWGRLRNAYQSALIDAEVRLLEYYDLLTFLRGDVAANYFRIRQFDSQIQLFDSTLTLRREGLRITRLNYQAGRGNALDVARAETQLKSAEAQRTLFVNQRTQAEVALAVLLGQAPSQFALAAEPLAVELRVPEVAAGMPSQLLLRRADVFAATKSLEAENARIGVAKAAMLPTFRINPLAGLENSRPTEFFANNSTTFTLSTTITQPLFNYGRNKARVNIALARYREVQALYQQTVLGALQEVESQLAQLQFLREQYIQQKETVDAALRAFQLALQQYKAGYTSYLEVVVAEQTALLNQVELVDVEGNLYVSTINLMRALGGSWRAGAQVYQQPDP